MVYMGVVGGCGYN